MTSHDLMRRAMQKHGVTADELVDALHDRLGGDRSWFVAHVDRFVTGGPSSIAICMVIVNKSVERAQATHH